MVQFQYDFRLWHFLQEQLFKIMSVNCCSYCSEKQSRSQESTKCAIRLFFDFRRFFIQVDSYWCFHWGWGSHRCCFWIGDFVGAYEKNLKKRKHYSELRYALNYQKELNYCTPQLEDK